MAITLTSSHLWPDIFFYIMLHNRLTHKMLLKPFNLATTRKFLEALGHKYKLHQIIELYMVTGGIPYYLKHLTKGKFVVENIEAMCFSDNGILYDEFIRLFESLYKQADINLKIIRAMVKRKQGISRDELLKAVNMQSGGAFKKRIRELESGGFIQSFIPYGREKRDVFYRVIDEYSLFYLQWIEPAKAYGHEIPKGYWQSKHHAHGWYSWAGYSFETICIKHAEQIRKALGIQNIGCTVASWRYLPKKGEKIDGAQIDLLFDRDDDAITICEVKFSNKEYVIDKAYAKNLLKKMELFESRTKTKKQLFLAMIVASGLKANLWSEDLVNAVVVLEDLFD